MGEFATGKITDIRPMFAYDEGMPARAYVELHAESAFSFWKAHRRPKLQENWAFERQSARKLIRRKAAGTRCWVRAGALETAS